MTAPTMGQLAGWDVPQLRGAVGRLGQVADRLPPWRTRLDILGRRLGSAECWSGQAGSVAAAALVELSTVASRVAGALDSSTTDLRGLGTAAEEAQEWAAGAIAAADAAGAGWDATGQLTGLPPLPTAAMAADQVADVLADRRAGALAAARAEEARAAAARALAWAVEARQPLTGIGVAGSGPVGFDDLVVRLAPTMVSTGPPLPWGSAPQAVAGWWMGLTAAEQLAVVDRWPGAVGALDGLPGWARDRANRSGLRAALDHLPPGSPGLDTARAVESALTALEADGRVAQLLQFDPAGDLVAISAGDLDGAAAVAVLVPGIETTPVDDLSGLVGDATRVLDAAGAVAPGVGAAAVAWLGYRTPTVLTAPMPFAARRGGPALDRALDGFAAARSGAGGAPSRTTVIAHSYGTVVAGQAVRSPGRLAADALVLLGSPGLAGGGADDLEAQEVYGAWSTADPVSWLQWFGDTPSDPSFGDIPLPTELTEGHTDYYDLDRPTLTAIADVVTGVGTTGEDDG